MKKQKMYIRENFSSNSKTTVVFISGFQKSCTTWNVTERGKEINVEKTISLTYSTLLIEMEDEDYLESVENISLRVNEILENEEKIILIVHSYAAFYAISLAKMYKNKYNKIILIDPTVKNDDYLNYLYEKEDDIFTRYKIENFSLYPDFNNFPQNVIVYAHLNLDTEDNLNKVFDLDKITKMNVKSKLMVHCNVGHMIHYKIPAVIIESIKDIIKK
jgi:pimeloyl-ACP methyl ester carboxylesterase